MIYSLYETMRRIARPLDNLVEMTSYVASHSANPFRKTLPYQLTSAYCDVLHRVLKEYPKPEYNVTDFETGENIIEQEVLDLPFAKLLRFPVDNDQSVLIASALSGHHSTLLRDTVRGFARDFVPYITDWKDAKSVPVQYEFSLDDYIEHLISCIEAIGPGVHLVATCQSAPAAMVATAWLAKNRPELTPVSLTLMAGPIDTRINPNTINHITEYVPLKLFRSMNIHRIPGSSRRVYPGFYQLAGFVSMNAKLHIGKHWDYFCDRLVDRDTTKFTEFYDEYNAVLDMSEAFYIDTLRRVFFEHHLPKGIMEFRGALVDFSLLDDLHLLTVEGANDDLCPVGQTKAAHAIINKIPDQNHSHYEQEGVGHMGVFSGSKFQAEIYPVIRDFIKSIDSEITS